MYYILFYIIQFTWGIIQNLLGFFLYIKYHKKEHTFYHGSIVTYHKGKWGGVSLGVFIFINGNKDDKWIRATRVHEYGHSIQSFILGPLYMLIIGLPSFLWCNLKRYRKLREEKGISYFSFYPEKWANYLGSKVTKESAP